MLNFINTSASNSALARNYFGDQPEFIMVNGGNPRFIGINQPLVQVQLYEVIQTQPVVLKETNMSQFNCDNDHMESIYESDMMMQRTLFEKYCCCNTMSRDGYHENCMNLNSNYSNLQNFKRSMNFSNSSKTPSLNSFKETKSGINQEDLKELDYETYEKALDDGTTITIYQCKFPGCTKEFNRAWGILDHGRTHKGIKPYCCQWCPKKFTQKGNLIKHHKQHLDPTLEQRKRYRCPYCSSKYTEKYNFKMHMKKKHPEIEIGYYKRYIAN